VFEHEPLPGASRLRSLANCWLAPHNANSSVAAAERVHERTLRSLLDVLHGATAVGEKSTPTTLEGLRLA